MNGVLTLFLAQLVLIDISVQLLWFADPNLAPRAWPRLLLGNGNEVVFIHIFWPGQI